MIVLQRMHHEPDNCSYNRNTDKHSNNHHPSASHPSSTIISIHHTGILSLSRGKKGPDKQTLATKTMFFILCLKYRSLTSHLLHIVGRLITIPSQNPTDPV